MEQAGCIMQIAFIANINCVTQIYCEHTCTLITLRMLNLYHEHCYNGTQYEANETALK